MKLPYYMLLIGCIAALGWCNFPRKPPVQATREDVRGVPPPKPPDCPDLPELANLKLADGGLADVRIFRDGNETFYVPMTWYRWEAGGHPDTASSYWEEQKLLDYDYQVHEIECPGVVHTGPFHRGTPSIYRTVKRLADLTPNVSQDSTIDRVVFMRFGPHHPLFEKGLFFEDLDLGNKGTGRAIIRLSEYHWAIFDYFIWLDIPPGGQNGIGPIWEKFRAEVMASKTWKAKRESVREFYAWLKTPPKDRDNDRKFKLGLKQK